METSAGGPIFIRTLNIGSSPHDLLLRVANEGTHASVSPAGDVVLGTDGGFVILRIPAGSTPLNISIRLAKNGGADSAAPPGQVSEPLDLSTFTRGGPPAWRETIPAPVVASGADGPFSWERLTLPLGNPWRSRLRTSGIDFLRGGSRAVVCTWDGDVWQIDGLDDPAGELAWRRIAAGLFQPLGIKVRDGAIFVTCRDQLVALRDLNGDGETDFYECINSDHQVSEHFHEFAMGLQTDPAGNFYYAKSARHARTALLPQHGTLLKIAADGSQTEILARGFRAANGVCLNPDGSFFVTDQEGHWMPANRINRIRPGPVLFYGNCWGGGAPADTSDAVMEPPVCWLEPRFDRSPAELLWVKHPGWGALRGGLLTLSYGYGRIGVVLRDSAAGVEQGAVCALPIPDFPTGLIRGREHPISGDLYVCGLAAWATSATQQEGGIYRLRPTGNPARLPVGWKVGDRSIELTFSEILQTADPLTPGNFVVKAWGLRRSANYGSPRLNETRWPVMEASILADGRTLRLAVPDLQPSDVVEITCKLMDEAGNESVRVIEGTIRSP